MDNNTSEINPNISKLKLSQLTLIAYGTGDFASNLCWTFIGSYLSVFYTDALGLAPALASTLMLVARIGDAVFDPVFGAIAERTKSKYGRFRPYILFGAPVLAVLTVIAFTKLSANNSFNAIFAFVIYLLCGFAYTVVNLSYGSLSTVMTTDQDDVSQLNSYRMIGTHLSSIILNAVTPILLTKLSGSPKFTTSGFTKTAIVFAILSLPLFYFTALNCHERVTPVSKKIKLKDTIKSVLKNKPLVLIFFIQLLAMTAFFGRMGVLAYYCMYNIKKPALMSAFMALPSAATVIGILATKNYIIKVGKKKMTAIGYIGAGLSLILMFFVGKASNFSNIPLLLVFNGLYGFFCFSFPIPMAMVTDAINYGEYKFGVRSDGTSYATVSLSTKFGQAIGVSVALFIMSAMGYQKGGAPTASAISGINISTNLLMGILYFACLIPLFLYPLSEKKNDEIQDKLTRARENIDFSKSEFPKLDSSEVVVNSAKESAADEKVAVSKHEKVDDLFAPVDGKLIPLDQVKDPVLSKGILGTGFAVQPQDGSIHSPVSGTIINIFEAKHAIGFHTDDGLELLVHMGINTYDLEGKPFDLKCSLGQKVSAGDPIAEVNLDMLRKAGKGTDIIVILTNMAKVKKLVMDTPRAVQTGESIGRVILKA